MTLLEGEDAGKLRVLIGVMTIDQLALVLDVTPDTLREWRRLKQGPDYVKTGKGVMYRIEDVQDWMRRNTVPVTRV
jgi:hypothetical protein